MGYGDYLVRPGLGNTNSYLISGTPFVTGGAIDGAGANNGEACIVFPTVCKSVTVSNNTAAQPLYIHFASRANADVVNKHHFVELTSLGDKWTFNVRASAIYVSMKNNPGVGSFSLGAELTVIERKELAYPLTGSGISAD